MERFQSVEARFIKNGRKKYRGTLTGGIFYTDYAFKVAAWCSGNSNTLVSNNVVALQRERLLLGWMTVC